MHKMKHGNMYCGLRPKLTAPSGVSLCMTFAEDSELVWRQLASMKLKKPKERELEIGKKKTQCSGVLIFEVRETAILRPAFERILLI